MELKNNKELYYYTITAEGKEYIVVSEMKDTPKFLSSLRAGLFTGDFFPLKRKGMNEPLWIQKNFVGTAQKMAKESVSATHKIWSITE